MSEREERSELAELVIRRVEDVIRSFLDEEDRGAFAVAMVRENKRPNGTTSRIQLRIDTLGPSAQDIRAQIYGRDGRMLGALLHLAQVLPEVRAQRASLDLRLPPVASGDVGTGGGRHRYMEREVKVSDVPVEQQRAEMSRFIRSLVCQIVDEADVPRIRVNGAPDPESSFDAHLVSVLPGARPLQGLLIGSGGLTASALQIVAQAHNNARGFERGVTVTIERNEVPPAEGADLSSRTLAARLTDVVHRRRTA